MPITKYASFEVSEILDVKGSRQKLEGASLSKVADYDDYRTDDGYLYVRIRAISSRVNKNHDGWPSVELAGSSEIFDRHQASDDGFTLTSADGNKEYGFATFTGKPIFVDHHNSDPKRTRGAIVDARFNVLDHKTASSDTYWSKNDTDPEHLPASEVELLLEVDAKSYPKLAKAIINGDIDGFSMGCDVDRSKCSHCGNEATAPDEYCEHIRLKGAQFKHPKTGKMAKAYENCYGIKFFEISAVFDPADETALAREVRSSVEHEGAMSTCAACGGTRIVIGPNGAPRCALCGSDKIVSTAPPAVPHDLPSFRQTKTAQNPPPQSDLIKAPEEVDTLREERICPVCGSDMDKETCDVCGYEAPPENFDNPNLHKNDSPELDAAEEQTEDVIPADPEVPPPAEGEGQSYLQTRNSPTASAVRSDMAWTPSVHPKVARYVKAGDEPSDEHLIKDEDKPVTSRTAQDMIAAADRTNQSGETMSDQTKVAAEPADTSGKADKQVDVTGVGGVIDATNEEASKPEGSHGEPGVTVDVQGKGGVLQDSNEEASKPDEKQDTGKEVHTQDSGPTKTFDNSNEPNSAVSDKAVQSAAKGAQPTDKSGKPDERVDVEQEVNVSWNGGDKTDQWTGTSGNGVTRQQDPVTTKPTQSGGVKASGINSHVVAIFKLADAEVQTGLTPEEQKYERIAELEALTPEEVEAQYQMLSRVKTAGFGGKQRKTAATEPTGVGKVPSLKSKLASEEPTPEPAADEVLDSAIFA